MCVHVMEAVKGHRGLHFLLLFPGESLDSLLFLTVTDRGLTMFFSSDVCVK